MVAEVNELRKLLRKLVAIVFVGLALISLAGMMAVRTANNTAKIVKLNSEISKQNRAFLTNFSDYMRCLILTDPAVSKAYGVESYYNLCDELLFRNTGIVPNPTKITIPSTTTTSKP